MLSIENIEIEYNKKKLSCKKYVSYIKKLQKSGKERHHVFLKSIFGDNDIIISLDKRDHVKLHLLLVLDNIDKIKECKYVNKNLCNICLAAMFVHCNIKNINKAFYKEDKKLFDKYLPYMTKYTSKYSSKRNKKYWKNLSKEEQNKVLNKLKKISLFNDSSFQKEMSLRANESKISIETRKKNIKKVNDNGYNLKGILRRKVNIVINFCKTNSDLNIDTFSNSIASKSHQRVHEKETRWRMLFCICGQVLLDNGLSKKYFDKMYKEYNFLDIKLFNKWSKISIKLTDSEKKILHDYFSRLK